MHSNLQQALLAAIFLLSPVLWSASQAYDPRLTSVGVFQTYVATHLAGDKVDPSHRGSLLYAQRLGQLWEKHIKDGSRQSSEEIIGNLIRKDPVLNRHPKVWEGLTRPYGKDRIQAAPSFSFLFKALMNAEKSSEPLAHWEHLRRSFVAGMNSDQDAVFLKRLGSNLAQSSDPKIRSNGEQLIRHSEQHPILRAATDLVLSPNKVSSIIYAGNLVAQGVAQAGKAVGSAVGRFVGQNAGTVGTATAVAGHGYILQRTNEDSKSSTTEISETEFSFSPKEIAENLSNAAQPTQTIGVNRPEDTSFAPHNKSPEQRSLMELEKPGSQNWVGILTDFETRESPPQTAGLDRDLTFNRVRDLVKEIRRQQALTPDPKEKIRVLRQLALEAGLSDYRKPRRSMSEVLLGAGGNCESQTRLLTAILKDHPDLLPPGFSLRIFANPSHVAPVIFDGKTNMDLMSGEISDDSNPEVTYLKPEAILVGIARQDAKLRTHPKLDLKSAYIKGRPADKEFGSAGFATEARRFLDLSLYSVSNSLAGAHKSLFTEFPSLGKGTPYDQIPDKTTISYQLPHKVERTTGESNPVGSQQGSDSAQGSASGSESSGSGSGSAPRSNSGSTASPQSPGTSTPNQPLWLTRLPPLSEKEEVAKQFEPDRFPEIHCVRAPDNSPPFLSLTQENVKKGNTDCEASRYPITRDENRILGDPVSTGVDRRSPRGFSLKSHQHHPLWWMVSPTKAEAQTACVDGQHRGHLDFVGTPTQPLPPFSTTRAVIRMAEGPLCQSLRQTLGAAISVGGPKGQEILWSRMFQIISKAFQEVEDAYQIDRTVLRDRAEKKLEPLLPPDLSQRLQLHYSKKFYWAHVGLAMGFSVKSDALWMKPVTTRGTTTPNYIRSVSPNWFRAGQLGFNRNFSNYLDTELAVAENKNPFDYSSTTQYLRGLEKFLQDDGSPSSVDFKSRLMGQMFALGETYPTGPIRFTKGDSEVLRPCPQASVSLPRVGPLPPYSWPFVPDKPCSPERTLKGTGSSDASEVDRRALLYASGDSFGTSIGRFFFRRWDQKTSALMVEKLKNPDVVQDPYTGRPLSLRAYGISIPIDWPHNEFPQEGRMRLRTRLLSELQKGIDLNVASFADEESYLKALKDKHPNLTPLVEYFLANKQGSLPPG